MTRNPEEFWVRDQDLFLAQKIEVSVTAGARIDDGGKVLGKIVGVTAVDERKSKENLQSDLRHPYGLAVFPKLTVNRDFPTGSNCIQEGFAFASECDIERYDAGKQKDAFPLSDLPNAVSELADLISGFLASSRLCILRDHK
jgi:hypothetical protein